MEISVADYIQTLSPYVPGKPIEETQREYGLKEVIKLASNENPLGPSPAAVTALRKQVGELHRYPDSNAFHLKNALAKSLSVTPSQLVIGNGSNEVIDLLIRGFCTPGDAIVTSQAAFVAYRVCAQVHGVRCLETPLRDDLTFDLDAMTKVLVEDERARFAFVANPNNPTGTFVKEAELRQFLKETAQIRGGSIRVVLDYAYWEYVTSKEIPDPIELMREFPHVLILRTFSKVYGLAGLRIGYGVMNPDMAGVLEKIRNPFNVNHLGMEAARAALEDSSFVKESIKLNEKGMKFWSESLKELKIPFWRSQGNFLLVNTEKGLGRHGGEVYVECLKEGVIFRPVTNYGLPGALRISFGTMEENRVALKALKKVKAAGN